MSTYDSLTANSHRIVRFRIEADTTPNANLFGILRGRNDYPNYGQILNSNPNQDLAQLRTNLVVQAISNYTIPLDIRLGLDSENTIGETETSGPALILTFEVDSFGAYFNDYWGLDTTKNKHGINSSSKIGVGGQVYKRNKKDLQELLDGLYWLSYDNGITGPFGILSSSGNIRLPSGKTTTDAPSLNAPNGKSGLKISYLPPDVSEVRPDTVLPYNVELPIVSGDPIVGQILSISEGVWSGLPTPDITYQWMWDNGVDGWTVIDTNTNITVLDYPNTYLKCIVTGSNSAGSTSVESAIIGPIQNVPAMFQDSDWDIIDRPLPAGDGATIIITSLPNDNSSTITAVSYRINDGSWIDLPDVTVGSYNITIPALQESAIEIRASNEIGDGSNSDIKTITPTSSNTAPINTVLPVISGTSDVGNTLTVSNGTWTGTPSPTYTYQWQTAPVGNNTWSDISSATNNTLVLSTSQVNLRVRCSVTGNNIVGNSTVTTVDVGPVRGIPSVFGTAQWSVIDRPTVNGDGATITITSLPNANGSPITTINYQVNGTGPWVALSGITAGNYNITLPIGVESSITLRTTNGIGNSPVSAAKTVTPSIVNMAPVNTVAPTATGNPRLGQTLTGTIGTWTGNPTPTYITQWQYSVNGINGWTNITGATALTYVIPQAQATRHIRLSVTATNSVNTITTASNSLGPVLTPPSAIAAANWSTNGIVSDAGNKIEITISTLPANNGSPITDLEYNIDGGSWISLGGITTGTYEVTLLIPLEEVSVNVRAVNAIGAGSASTAKSATPLIGNMIINSDLTFTGASFAPPVILSEHDVIIHFDNAEQDDIVISGVYNDNVWTLNESPPENSGLCTLIQSDTSSNIILNYIVAS